MNNNLSTILRKLRITETEFDFRFSYLLHPTTGRSLTDFILDGISLLSIVVFWSLLFLVPSEMIGEAVQQLVIYTVLVLFAMGMACRNITTVYGMFDTKKLNYNDKRQYATIQRIRTLYVVTAGIAVVLTDKDSLSWIFIVAAIDIVTELVIAFWRYKHGLPFLP